MIFVYRFTIWLPFSVIQILSALVAFFYVGPAIPAHSMAVFEFLNAALGQAYLVLIEAIIKGPAFLDNVLTPGGAHCIATAVTVKELPVLIGGVVQVVPAAGHGAGGIAEREQEETKGCFQA